MGKKNKMKQSTKIDEIPIVIPNITYEFPYTPDIKSIKIVTETEDGEIISVDTIPEDVIYELTRIDSMTIPNIEYSIPYTDDLEQINIVTSIADTDRVIGFNTINKKSIYQPLRTGELSLKVDESEAEITKITINEVATAKGTILYKIDGITDGYVNKLKLESDFTSSKKTLPNGTILKYRIDTNDEYTSPEIESIDISYNTTQKTFKTVTTPRNLAHLINKLDGQINGVTHVKGNSIITNKATIQNYRVMLGSEDVVLRHIDDAYGYRKIDISIEEAEGYVVPLGNTNNNIDIIKSERKNTIIRSKTPLNKYARISITIPKN